MSFPDLTARTEAGAVDLVPFLRRDAGIRGVELHAWEREPAALALGRMGWSTERISHAAGMSSGDVCRLLSGRPKLRRTVTHCKNNHLLTEATTSWAKGYRQCLLCRRDRDRALRDAKRAGTA